MKNVFATVGALLALTGWLGVSFWLLSLVHDKWYEPLTLGVLVVSGLVMSEYLGHKTCECCKRKTGRD